ncbi:lipase member H [Monomorium pharaonis]|uniref:lipase member H n=1 Tax=Monomorium pharaonis TaxID=307658 RepID=UPI00063EEE97|nr:lipase member H [Monomorium pharaonis]
MLTSIVYYYVLLFFMTRIIPGQLNCSCDQPESDFATGVNLVYYKCNNETPATIAYPITAPEDMLTMLDKNKQTIFYIFGYLQNLENDNVRLITKALCYGRTDNVILLDWSKYSKGLYMTVFQNAEKIGTLFAKSIQKLKESDLDVSKIYIIGHSLGAHIAGFVGKCNKDFKIPRITALDPANPMFYPFGCYLTNEDASWIDVIHTDMGGYGTPTSMGTAEYYANGGTRPQPGCPLMGIPLSDKALCSHQRSVELYAELKYFPNKFMAKRCSSDFNYNSNEHEVTEIGYTASNVTGSFCFETGEQS